MPLDPETKEAPTRAPAILSTPQACHAAAESSSAPVPEAVSRLKHFRLAREILKALRHVKLSDAGLRVALVILEYSHLAGREAAPFTRQNQLCLLLTVDKSFLGRTLRCLFAKRILQRTGGLYSFRPAGEWGVEFRSGESGLPRQLELEEWLDRMGRQLGLNLFELDTALQERFLEGAPVDLKSSAVDSQSTRAVDPKSSGVDSQSTTTRRHINDYTNRSLNRSTLNGQNAAWRPRLQRVEEFLRLSGEAYLEDEMARVGGMWTILARQEGNLLERAVADLEDKERTNSPSEDRARRLTSLVRGWIGPARWSELFPGPARAI